MSEPYRHDTTFFPKDKIELPARLEAMRVGQVTSAVEQEANCIVPVATLDAADADRALGFDPYEDDALTALAEEQKGVIAPVIWYCPTGYTHVGPESGTFDMQLDAFAGYLENVMTTLYELGFKSVRIAAYVDDDDLPRSEPLLAACRFVNANLFNDLWKDPEIGRNWWDRPDRDELNWQRYALHELKRPDQPEFANRSGDFPLRLEQLTPEQLKNSVNKGHPIFIPSAVLENHGNHNPIGCDGYEAQDPLLMAAEEAPAVVAPTIWYGPTCYGVSGPELATTDIDGHRYHHYVKGIITGLAAMGFRDIVFVQVHQGSGGVQYNATAMAIQAYRSSLAATDLGPGWAASGREAPANIEIIHPPHAQYDHAGKNETSWMLHLRPDYTDLSLIRENDYRFCWNPGNESKLATAEWGETMCKKTVPGLAEIIQTKIKTTES